MKRIITEDSIDNMTHSVAQEFATHGIKLNEGEMTTLNDKIEHILFNELGIELS